MKNPQSEQGTVNNTLHDVLQKKDASTKVMSKKETASHDDWARYVEIIPLARALEPSCCFRAESIVLVVAYVTAQRQDHCGFEPGVA